MDLIKKYLGEGKIDEILGRGQAHVLSGVTDKKGLQKELKKRKIRFTISSKGEIVVGDDDFDTVEDFYWSFM